jgi:LPS O-antigen subunit length determinant protein (WzzB/FepE family)
MSDRSIFAIATNAIALFATVTWTTVAIAHPAHNKAFQALYVKDSPNAEWVKIVKKEAKCLVCHQGKRKKNLNPYGSQFTDLLETNEKDKEKLLAALQEVADRHSVADDAESPTYGELIAEGKLPGGELAALKQEPK